MTMKSLPRTEMFFVCKGGLVTLLAFFCVSTQAKAQEEKDKKPAALALDVLSPLLKEQGRLYGVTEWQVDLERGEIRGISRPPLGRSTRPSFSSRTEAIKVAGRDATVEYKDSFPDMFVTEGAFVETGFRLDFLNSHLLSPAIRNEATFHGEFSYQLTNRIGVAIAAPYSFLDRVDEANTSGFGDLEVGARFVLIGPDEDDAFKVALGLNVVAPTGAASRDLGEGHTIFEPRLLFFQKVGSRTFLQSNIGFEIGLGSEAERAFGYSLGAGHVFGDGRSYWFKYPTPIIEIDGHALLSGEDSGASVVNLTTGLRWQFGNSKKNFAGVAFRVPLTRERDFDSQVIFSFVRVFGAEEPEARIVSTRPTLGR